MTDLRIGILGAARIAPKAMIAPASEITGVRVTAIAARDRRKAQRFANIHNVPHVLDSYADLIASKDVDMVYNALPISLHAPWTIKAAQAGKHVLCEKPFAMTLPEAEAMNEAGADNHVRVIEAFHYRYHPAFVQCLEWIKAGRIGEVTDIDAEFSVPIANKNGEIRYQKHLGGGAMFDLGCYPLNWALTIIDAPLQKVEANATLTDTGVDATMQATLRFHDGAVARLRASMVEPERKIPRLSVTGTQGKIQFTNPLFPPDKGRLILKTKDEQNEADIDQRATFYHQLTAVRDAIKHGTALPTEGAKTLRQQAALDAVHGAAGIDVLGV